eukprot:CAMPEP_0198534680 /NCGR_PEP_ID=MMETSP1462-20131121/36581_1 /TAXON_ID=1333877 /ORGANISM="Brandtodinium nutriculum, Strain RCC3387" /LENGTH=49 /DNA_ID= /DNA_START= /DNA_END= /DNA_ORIENTATION=
MTQQSVSLQCLATSASVTDMAASWRELVHAAVARQTLPSADSPRSKRLE